MFIKVNWHIINLQVRSLNRIIAVFFGKQFKWVESTPQSPVQRVITVPTMNCSTLCYLASGNPMRRLLSVSHRT